VFAPDGRSRQCELCGWQEKVERKRPSPAEIIRSLQFTGQHEARDDDHEGAKLRLAQGIAAAKAGDKDEAFYCFDWVLQTDSSDAQRAEAWLWLSQIYEDDADRRLCLEQAIIHEPMNPRVRRGLALLDGRINPQEIIDPNTVKAETAVPDQPLTADADHFQCPRCAARMNYTPDGTALVCEYCSFRQELTAEENQVAPEYGIGGIEQDFIAALATARGHLQPVAMRALSCQSCGIELLLPPEAISATCPYCDSVYVAEAAETREILPPQALIPFTVNQDAARKALVGWFKKHKIERPRITPIVGIYLPVWTFDIGGEIRWKGKVRRGDDWVPVSGSKQLFYDDVLVQAVDKIRPSLAKELYAYDMTGMVAYDPRYLADWPAERYQLALADASLQARKQLIKDVKKHQGKLSPGQYVHDLIVNSSGLLVESYKLILLPLWMVHYKVEEAVYDVVINGQTGAVRGDRPQNVVGKLFSWLKGE
jgi:DNA-directed RNA polymerase subunit RPC12/RpoP